MTHSSSYSGTSAGRRSAHAGAGAAALQADTIHAGVRIVQRGLRTMPAVRIVAQPVHDAAGRR
jgi:hypothetical protein